MKKAVMRRRKWEGEERRRRREMGVRIAHDLDLVRRRPFPRNEVETECRRLEARHIEEDALTTTDREGDPEGGGGGEEEGEKESKWGDEEEEEDEGERKWYKKEMGKTTPMVTSDNGMSAFTP